MAFLDNQGVRTLVEQTKALVNKKVDKVPGKGLSTNDLTDELLAKIQSGTGSGSGMSVAEKAKLDGIADNATRVSFTQTADKGAAIGDITINGTKTTLYSPTTMTSDISMNGNKLTGVKNPTDGTDAANKQYVDDAVAKAATGGEIDLSGYMKISGETAMDGDLDMDNNSIENVANFTADFVVTNSKLTTRSQLILGNESNGNGTVSIYVNDPDGKVNNKITFYGDNKENPVVLDNIAEPTSGLQAANKDYVDTAIANVAAGEPIDLSGYVKKSGDNMTGELTVGQGDGNGVQLGKSGYINATYGDNTKATVLSAESTYSPPRVIFGNNNFELRMRGALVRPQYSRTANYADAKELALMEDLRGYLPLSGDTAMAGNLNMGNKVIDNVNKVNVFDCVTFNPGSSYAKIALQAEEPSTADEAKGVTGVVSFYVDNGDDDYVVLRNLNQPVTASDAATKQYVDDKVASISGGASGDYLPSSGGTLTGALTLNTAGVTATAFAVSDMNGTNLEGATIKPDIRATDAENQTVSRIRLDALDKAVAALKGKPVLLDNVAMPSSEYQAANKKYVDKYVDEKFASVSGGASDNYLPIDGGYLEGALTLNSHGVTAITLSVSDTIGTSLVGASIKPLANTADAEGNTVSRVKLDALDKATIALKGKPILLENIATPTSEYQAVNKKYVDNNFLSLAGGTMAGELDMNWNDIRLVRELEIADANYSKGTIISALAHRVDPDNSANKVAVLDFAGILDGEATMLYNIATPDTPYAAANKKYVDEKFASVSGGGTGNYLSIKGGSLEGALTLNSHGVTATTLSVSDRIDSGLEGASIKPLARSTDAEGNTVSRVKLAALDNAIAALQNKPVLLDNIATPASEYQAANKKYVDAKFASIPGGSVSGDYLPLSGGTMTGNLNLGNKVIENVNRVHVFDCVTFNAGSGYSKVAIAATEPTQLDDNNRVAGVVYFYADNGDDDYVVLRNINSPIVDSDAANKRYVDDAINALKTQLVAAGLLTE